jgi:hypothetical protein
MVDIEGILAGSPLSGSRQISGDLSDRLGDPLMHRTDQAKPTVGQITADLISFVHWNAHPREDRARCGERRDFAQTSPPLGGCIFIMPQP